MTDELHPLIRDDYTLATPEVNRFVNAVRAWVSSKTRGGIVIGRPRVGKSSAVEYLRRSVERVFGHWLPFYVVACEKSVRPSKSDFLTRMLRAVGHALSESGKHTQKFSRLVEFICADSQRSADNRVMLVADEAQWMHDIELEWLIEIYNALEKRGVRLYVVLIGQPELEAKRNALRASGQFQIVGRFMVGEHMFKGVQSQSDVAYILTRYDSYSEYPPGSKTSFSQHFARGPFSEGWRLASHDASLWKAFQRARENGKVYGPPNIPMSAFTGVVDALLKALQRNAGKPPQEVVSDQMLDGILMEMNYIALEQSLVDTDRPDGGRGAH